MKPGAEIIARTRDLQMEVERLRDKLQELKAVARAPIVQADFDEAVEALATTVEELHTAQEELHQQSESLAEAQHKLEEERRRYQDLFDFAAAALFVTDADGAIEEANRAAAELLGVRQRTLVGKPLRVYVAEPHRAGFYALLERLREEDRILEQQLELRARGAQSVPVELGVAVMRRSAGRGRPATVLRWSVRDIRNRKRTQDELQERESRLRAILDTAVDAIITIDETGMVQSANPATERIFGYAAGELMGRDVSLLMPSPYREEHAGYLARYLETGEPHIIGIGRETVGLRKDGTIIPLDLTVSEFEAGGRRMFTGVHRDISERRHLQAEAERRRDELAHAGRVAAIGELTSSIIHEVSQPLSAVVYYAQACARLQASGQAGRVADTLGKIVKQCERALQVTERLRRFGRRDESRAEPLDLNRTIGEVVGLVRHDLQIHRVELRLELADAVPTLRADKLGIEQVLVNLFRNAVDALAEIDPAQRRITIRTAPAAGGVEVVVIDTGCGLPEEGSERLMEAFFTTKPEGTGLGLSISRSIVEAHGGRLWAAQNAERGAAFHFFLPAGGGE